MRIHNAEVNNILMMKMVVLTLILKIILFQVRNGETEEETQARQARDRAQHTQVWSRSETTQTI